MFEFFQNQGCRAFAHDKSVAQLVEWARRKIRIVAATHRSDDIECADGDRGQRRLGASGHNDIGKIVANVTERFSN